MENAIPLLLAAGWDDLLQFIVPFFFLIVWIISQIVEAKKQVVPPREKGPAPPPEPQQQPQARMQNEPPPAAGRQADPLRQQVDEFLRRAGRGPQPQEPRPRRPQPKIEEIEVLLDDEAAAPRREPLAEPLRPIERPAAASERPVVVPAKKPRPPQRAAAPRRETVAEHVAERMGKSVRTFDPAASRLGQRIIQEDAQFDVQLKAKFDHTVGTLAGSTLQATELQPVPASDTPAAQIAAMLSSPDGVRQAIVINEVLRRPTDRW